MDRLISSISEDIKYIREKTDELARNSATQSEQLRLYAKQQEELRVAVSELEDELRPIQAHVALVNALSKVLVVLLGGGASVAAIARLLKGLG